MDHLQLRRPDDAQDQAATAAWFSRLAEDLLNRTGILISGALHRLVELELYYDEPAAHPDPFTHGHPLQRRSGRWYLHRIGRRRSGAGTCTGSATASAAAASRAST